MGPTAAMTRLLTAAFLVVLTAVVLVAQVASYGVPVSTTGLATGELPSEKSGFTVCRLMYRSVTEEALGSGWTTDYPAAERNLMIRLAELTLMPVITSESDEPLHVVVRATDKTVFQCPFLFASDVGTIGFLPDEVTGLREYLLKGGFLWVDDFWGQTAFNRWSAEIARVLPELPIVELPPDHPIFATFFEIERVPQIPAISFWMTARLTAERGGAVARMYGIFDEKGRLLVLMSHNTDIADGWEREGENQEFFELFSPLGYAVGVNAVIWNLTH
jgi:hypothetical protein